MGLFDDVESPPSIEPLDAGAVVLRHFLTPHAAAVYRAVQSVAEIAPFRHMITPGGFKMSAAMTNCGEAGWVTDKSGYRYSRIDPLSGAEWPAMPEPIRRLAAEAAKQAGFDQFAPDVCLINRYEPGAKMSLHQDLDEKGFDDPIVSFSLGLPVKFLWGGQKRSDRPRRIHLEHGDVVVWGGPTRLTFHGVDPLTDGQHPLTGSCRINLTFRRALT